MTPQASLPFTADEAARQEAILAAEIAAGWLIPPPEEWQLADPEGDLPPDAACLSICTNRCVQDSFSAL